MLLLIVPATIGWSLLAFAQSVTMLLWGRFVTGMSLGGFTIMSALYISEMAEKTIRGALGNLTQLMILVGILYADVLATLMSIPNYTLMCGIVPLIFGCIFIFMPESPVYLVKKGVSEQAQIILQRLRGDQCDIKTEMREIESSLKVQQGSSALKVN